MTVNITTLTDVILEKTTPKIKATLKDEDGNVIPGSSLATLKLTYHLKDAPTNTPINNRTDQNVLNTNGVTVDANGLLTWQLATADTTIFGSRQKEVHRAVFEWTYGNPVKTGRHVIDMTIMNLEKVS